MAKRNRLKNGLDSLFEDNFHIIEETSNTTGNNGTQTLRISLIEPDRNQPRTDFDEEKLNELAENIRQHGVLQPILVRPMGNEAYQIVAGERRWRASRIAGLSEIPVIIKELTDMQAAQIALIENVQRADLNPIEEAKAYKRLSEEFGMTQKQISKIVGKSRAAIANSIRLLKLTPKVQKALSDNEISVGHAKILAGVDDVETQNILVLQLTEESMSVRQFENHVQKVLSGEYKKKADDKSKIMDSINGKNSFGDSFKAFVVETNMALKQEYGLDVSISAKKNGSVKCEINFKNEDEFRDALKRFTNMQN